MNTAIWFAAFLAGAGCGLVDSEVTDVDVSLPARDVTVDASDWRLSSVGQLPSVDCADDQMVCATTLPELCGLEGVCSAACGSDGTCEISVRVMLWNTFDLAAERPQLQQIDGQPLVGVRIDRVYYSVSENNLDIRLPALTVSVAPEGTMSLDGAGAEVIGTIPPLPAARTIPEADLELDRDGLDRLADRLKDYTSRFNLIIGSVLTFEAGDRLPQGRMVMAVHATATGMTGL